MTTIVQNIERTITVQQYTSNSAEILANKNAAEAANTAAQAVLVTLQPIVDDLTALLAVEEKLTEIEAVEAKLAEIETLATDIANVNTVADNITGLNALYASLTELLALFTNLTALLAVEDRLTEINAVNAKLTELTAIYNALTELLALHTNLAALLTVEDNLTAINAVNAAITNINTAATNIAAINTAASNIAAIIAAPTHATTASEAAAAALVTKGQVDTLKDDVVTLKSDTNTLKLAAATSETNAGQSAAAAASSAAGAEADAIQLLRLHNPDLVFSGFVNTSTATPAHVANKAYIATASGTIFGIAGVVKGQVIWSNGVSFVVESVISLFEPQKNRYNPALAVDNKYYNNSDGSLSSIGSAWSVTGKISVTPSTVYSIWKTGSVFGYLHFYDINGTWIGSNANISGVTNIIGGYQFTTPSNCYYVATWGQRGSETFNQWKSLIMLEFGDKTSFEAYNVKIKNSIVNSYSKTEIDSFINEVENKIKGDTIVVKSGDYIYIRTEFDNTRDLVQSFKVNDNSNFVNTNISIENVYLILKTKGNTVTELTTNTLAHLLNATDDETPSFYNSTYIGGNHGCSKVRLITVNAHGKTSVDIGSEWTDQSGRKYYILRIVDLNRLWVISENIGTGDVWVFDDTISGSTLTHSANATNTSTMNIAVNAMGQLFPAIKNNVKKIFLDGKTEITDDGIYYCTFCDIVDQYDIVNPASMLLNLIAAVGTTYNDTTLNAALKNGVASVFNQILYRIQGNGALQLIYGWRNYQEINMGYVGFLQANPPQTTVYPKLKLYMPKILPLSDGVKTWDFRNIEDYDISSNVIPAVTNTYWENLLSPPERAVEFLCDSSGNKKIGFAIGYDITKGIGKNRKDLVRDAWYFYTSRKLYPRGIDDKLNPLLANKWYSCVGYRIFFNAESDLMGTASTFYHYELGKEVIVVFDYHTQVAFDVLQLPAKYVGMTVSVVEKSSNLTIHTDEVMQDGITVSVGAGAYAYCVLKVS